MKEAMKRLALAALTAITALGITSVNALPVHAEPVTGKEWTTPEAVRVNQTEARSAIIPFDDMESAKQNPTLIILIWTGHGNFTGYLSLQTSLILQV